MSIYFVNDWPAGSQWDEVLQYSFRDPRYHELVEYVARRRVVSTVYPRRGDVFQAFRWTPFEKVRVVILGQDPYHGPGQAHGLSFSVLPDTPPPPSLRNIFKELVDDLGCEMPTCGNLTAWAQQGVLLLNTILTVEEGQPLSHAGRGWEWFTDNVIAALAQSKRPLIFVLWGKPAQKKAQCLLNDRHHLIVAPHPSPLSAYRGFLGSRPFSTINRFLAQQASLPIDWALNSVPATGHAPRVDGIELVRANEDFR